MKRTISILLCLMLVLSLAAPVFADGDVATSNLTINTTAGHTYKVYQLLVGDVSDLSDDGSGTLSNVEIGSSVKLVDDQKMPVGDFLDAIKDKETGNYLQNEELANAAYAFVNTDAPAYTVVGTGSNVVTEKVQNGYYIVVDTWTGDEIKDDVLSRYMVAVVGDTTMSPKVDKPEIDKKIVDEDANAAIDTDKETDTAAIGDTIEFEITGKVPNTEGYKYYYYVVHDTMSKGLTLDTDSFEVTVGGKTLTKGTHYHVHIASNTDGTTKFELAFEDLKALVDSKVIAVGNDIVISYTATINDQAEIGVNPNTNTAKLEYSNNPGDSERNDVEGKPGTPEPGTATGEGPEDQTETYVTELTIDKVDNKGMVLTGAEFTLTGTNLNKVIIKTATEFRPAVEGETATYYELKNGTFTKDDPSPAAEGEDGYNANLYVNPDAPTHVRVVNVTTSTEAEEVENSVKKITAMVDDSGRVTFTGLNVGEYELTETKTPEGYNTIDPIKFTISYENGNFVSNNEIIVVGENNTLSTEVVNVSGSQLPSTGGVGTTLFYVFGSVMFIGAAVLLITKKRMAA